MIEALGALKQPCDVILHTDSQYVMKGITEWIRGWKAKGWRTASKEPVKNVDLWKRLEERYGITIKGIRPAQTLEEQARTYGDKLWEREPEKCCALRKVAPLGPALKGYDAWVTAIRRDQTANRASALPIEWDAKNGLVKVNPLVRWQKEAVWAYIKEWDVPYNALHDKGYEAQVVR